MAVVYVSLLPALSVIVTSTGMLLPAATSVPPSVTVKVAVSDALLAQADAAAKGPDKGRSFFLELAAKQVAVAKGLGFQGAYLGGTHRHDDMSAILDQAESFAEDDWKEFAKEIQYSEPDAFYLFQQDPVTGLNRPGVLDANYEASLTPENRRKSLHNVPDTYPLNRWVHDSFFEPNGWGFGPVHSVLEWLDNRKGWLPDVTHRLEYVAKATFFDCHDCGDCSLPDIAYLCPESQCAKNERNGPCGGTHDGLCEVEEVRRCIWARAYERYKAYGEEEAMMRDCDPIFTDGAFRYTSGWTNYYLGRDHTQLPQKPKEPQRPEDKASG